MRSVCNLKELWDKTVTETEHYAIIIAEMIENIYTIINIYYKELNELPMLNNLINLSESIIRQIIGNI